MKNISVRVPWHEAGWTGDQAPCPVCDAEPNSYKCIRESGHFMSSKATTIEISHPFQDSSNPVFKNLDPTTQFPVPPYAFLARPFRWVLMESNRTIKYNYGERQVILNTTYPTQFDNAPEEDVRTKMGFSTDWVTDGTNQANIFKYFYHHIEPQNSLVFPYVKRCSLTDTLGRILIGVGTVASLGEQQRYAGKSPVDPCIWERIITHTIRDSREDGFLLPFTDIKQFLAAHPDRDPDDFLVIIPPEYLLDFSYATEYVSSDATIWVLTRLTQVLSLYQSLGIGGDWSAALAWVNDKLQTAWATRPVYPGFGAILSVINTPYYHDIADCITRAARDGHQTIWEAASSVFLRPHNYMTDDISTLALRGITTNLGLSWRGFYTKHKSAIETLARFDLTATQMQAVFALAKSDPAKFRAIIENPYLLYETTRTAREDTRISLQKIDYTIFPQHSTAAPTPFTITEPDDERRLRALLIYELERTATTGSTLYSETDFLVSITNFRPELPLNINEYTLAATHDYFGEEIIIKTLPVRELDDNLRSTTTEDTFYKLRRLHTFENAIRDFVAAHTNQTYNFHCDWRAVVSSDFTTSPETIDVLNHLAIYPFSILTGGAGTGKTTIVTEFCKCPDIHKNGILALAPTGKARVVLGQRLQHLGATAETVAQFLYAHHCWNPESGEFSIPEIKQSLPQYETVIIDECSMLTEEMFGSLFSVLGSVKRVILLGDPNQLPPIGTGKPFYDLVSHCATHLPAHLNKLTRIHRQASTDVRLDVEFARQFIDDPVRADGLLSRIATDSTNIEFIRYEDPSEIPEKLPTIITSAAHLTAPTDRKSFDLSLGGTIQGGKMTFLPADAPGVNNWQIISPYKNREFLGSDAINSIVHHVYRTGKPTYEYSEPLRPLGDQRIVLGDKVINITNQKNDQVKPTEGALNYVANGETGFVSSVGYDYKHHHYFTNIAYSSQPGYLYRGDLGSAERDGSIELAYALTTHKVQGSTYGNSIVVLYDSSDKYQSRFISRELIYTALTRQTDKVYILYNREPHHLLAYADNSEIARRLTDLFSDPDIVTEHRTSYDNNLIHITLRGDRVRSKSELVIANLLYAHRGELDYQYEHDLHLTTDDARRYRLPDFTITRHGHTIYWEHLGMLGDDSYRRAWEAKKQFYADQGISEAADNLIITEDDEQGGLNSQLVEQKITKILKNY